MTHHYRDLHPYGWVVTATLTALALAGAIGIVFE